MNPFDRDEFEKNDENMPAEYQNREPFTDQNDPGEEERSAMTPSETPSAMPPQANYWYGVSYQNQGNGYMQNESGPNRQNGGKSPKKLKILLIAAALAGCVLLSGVAGFLGSLLGTRIVNLPGPTPNAVLAGNGNGDQIGEVYGTDGDRDYPYSEVVLQKNDGSALTGSTQGSAGENGGSILSATAAVKDAVVEIMTTSTSNYGSISAGAGSGVIVHADGIIVTNNHVIEGATAIRVRLTNGNTYAAVVRGTDEDGDIAVIKIQPQETLTVAKLGYSGALALGEAVIAIGNPLGELGGTVTNGIISALEREVKVDGVVMTLIQTNAAINSGNSGGGLFNLAGELIGIVNAKYAAEGVEGLGFAIPIDTAVVSINNLLRLGYIPDIPALGVEVIAEQAYLGGNRVLMPYVSSVQGSSNLKEGDYIYSVNGSSVVVNYYTGTESPLDILKRLIRACKVDETVTLGIYRNSQAQTVEVTLVEYIPVTP
ncbi:MAG: trypsin-like serine protease [Ruminococcaceae bacterium]|nr:trypsin-like serine protease [Oscillospiraceae bacterium]